MNYNSSETFLIDMNSTDAVIVFSEFYLQVHGCCDESCHEERFYTKSTVCYIFLHETC